MSICIFSAAFGGPTSQMVVQSPSYLALKGTSTLHDYECKTSSIQGTIEMDPGLDSFTNVEIYIPVKSIHSESSSMDENMYESLKADENPDIRFSLLKADSMGDTKTTRTDSTFKLYGKLTVAGKEKTIDLEVVVQKKGNKIIGVHGSKKLLMTDFGIKPPTFMLGVLRTGNEVTIEFDLQLKDTSFTTQSIGPIK
jgi:polyisoprenoid-binding protein YceI